MAQMALQKESALNLEDATKAKRKFKMAAGGLVVALAEVVSRF